MFYSKEKGIYPKLSKKQNIIYDEPKPTPIDSSCYHLEYMSEYKNKILPMEKVVFKVNDLKKTLGQNLDLSTLSSISKNDIFSSQNEGPSGGTS